MTWTKEKPAVPGSYWYRGGIFEAGVVLSVDERLGKLVAYFGLDRIEIENANGEWAGPIPLPTRALSIKQMAAEICPDDLSSNIDVGDVVANAGKANLERVLRERYGEYMEPESRSTDRNPVEPTQILCYGVHADKAMEILASTFDCNTLGIEFRGYIPDGWKPSK